VIISSSILRSSYRKENQRPELGFMKIILSCGDTGAG